MEQNYNINEILSAVDEIYNKKKEKKIEHNKNKTSQKDYSACAKKIL